MTRTLLLLSQAFAYNNGVGLKPALGWNTWCTQSTCGQAGISPGSTYLHDVCNDTEIRSIAEAMISNGMHQLGYNRINLDGEVSQALRYAPDALMHPDCWVAEDRTADGQITFDKERFPNGMKSLINWLHGKGLLFGSHTEQANMPRHPDA